MPDHIRYDILVQDALRGMVRDVLADAARKGLTGDHHFFITFDTTAEGVRLSDRLREQYPEEMSIVLQHQFWDLKVTDKAFEVGLSFGGVAERLYIPFAAIKGFADPSVQFGLQFEELTASPNEGGAKAESAAEPQAAPPPKRPAGKARTEARAPRGSVPSVATPAPPQAAASSAAPTPPPQPPNKSGAEVVRLDRFRKK
jgi:uncharacterized protein